ncbi:MAG: hypothetical protein Q4B60_00735 [Erysipelotrichaceae bacterium]|nr:hypothetical protein [Erysipelotrichaceae bacterium]
MKKIITILLAILLCVGLAACGSKENNNNNTNTNNTNTNNSSKKVTDTAKKIADKYGVKIDAIYKDYAVCEGEEKPDRDELYFFLEEGKDNQGRLSDMQSFVDYFKTLADDGKVYTNDEFDQEWFEEVLDNELLTYNKFAIKKDGKGLVIVQNQYDNKWSSEARKDMYTYNLTFFEVEAKTETSEPVIIGGETSKFKDSRAIKFYSQFEGGEMYMEYEVETDDESGLMTLAVKGTKTYIDTTTQDGGVKLIIENDKMYMISDESMMVFEMALQSEYEGLLQAMPVQEDINEETFRVGSKEVEGKVYYTESWDEPEGTTTLCFDGDTLVYIITEIPDSVSRIKIVNFSYKVDDKLFEVPDGYTLYSY